MNTFVATSHSNQLLLLIFSIIISTCHGWILFCPSTSSSALSHCANQHQYQHQYLYAKNNGEYDNNEEEEGKPDLFDYFDPLKSPHEYPDGIDSTSSSSSSTATTSSNNNEKETTSSNNSNDSEKKKYSINVFGMEKHKQQQQHESSSSVASIRNDDDNNNNSPADTDDDLFDYFDPLKSPHEYPNGIDGSNSNTITTTEEEKRDSISTSSNNNKPFSMNVFGKEYGLQAKPLDVVSEDDENELASQATTKSATAADNNNNNNQDDDLFDYFDPLKSPHEYPNGIGGLNTDDQTNDIDDNDDEEEDRYDPLDLRKKRNAIMAKKENDNDDNNNSSSSSRSKTKVGILLMDHGSRNQDSNKRLQYIADLYQQQMTIMEKSMQGSNVDEDEDVTTTTTTVVVVRAAHMEIAKPSIQDGIQSLLEENVDEIVCHPFFLSPAGRHVKEDIPEIINKAIETLDVKIPIITTEPIGSNIQLMIGAIHASVRENSNLLNI